MQEASIQTFFYLGHDKNECPTIVPQVSSSDLVTRKIGYAWNLYYFPGTRKELPVFVESNPLDASFAYCKIPNIEEDNYINFSVFLKTFDAYSWLALILAFIAITVITGPKKWLATLSALLTYGSWQKLASLQISSSLFVLWLFIASVINNFYSGLITSKLISPPQNEIFANIEDLQNNNFTLLFRGNYLTVLGARAALQKLPASGIHPYLQVYRDMVNHAESVATREKLYQAFQSKVKNYAVAMPWHFVADLMSTFNKRGKATKSMKHCYIGKELIPAGKYFYSFLPPKK